MKYIVLMVCVMLSGCAEFSAVKSGLASHGAQAADEELAVAEWGVCKAPTVGAWQRRYGGNSGKAAGWRMLCGESAVSP